MDAIAKLDIDLFQHVACVAITGTCNLGWVVDEYSLSCRRFGGGCDHGRLIEDVTARRKEDECGSCFQGYGLSNTTGLCVALCDPGHYQDLAADSSAAECKPYGGACENGALATQAGRTRDNQCGSCDVDFTLLGTSCVGAGGTTSASGASYGFCADYTDGNQFDACTKATKLKFADQPKAVVLDLLSGDDLKELPHPLSGDIECAVASLLDDPAFAYAFESVSLVFDGAPDPNLPGLTKGLLVLRIRDVSDEFDGELRLAATDLLITALTGKSPKEALTSMYSEPGGTLDTKSEGKFQENIAALFSGMSEGGLGSGGVETVKKWFESEFKLTAIANKMVPATVPVPFWFASDLQKLDAEAVQEHCTSAGVFFTKMLAPSMLTSFMGAARRRRKRGRKETGEKSMDELCLEPSFCRTLPTNADPFDTSTNQAVLSCDKKGGTSSETKHSVGNIMDSTAMATLQKAVTGLELTVYLWDDPFKGKYTEPAGCEACKWSIKLNYAFPLTFEVVLFKQWVRPSQDGDDTDLLTISISVDPLVGQDKQDPGSEQELDMASTIMNARWHGYGLAIPSFLPKEATGSAIMKHALNMILGNYWRQFYYLGINAARRPGSKRNPGGFNGLPVVNIAVFVDPFQLASMFANSAEWVDEFNNYASFKLEFTFANVFNAKTAPCFTYCDGMFGKEEEDDTWTQELSKVKSYPQLMAACAKYIYENDPGRLLRQGRTQATSLPNGLFVYREPAGRRLDFEVQFFANIPLGKADDFACSRSQGFQEYVKGDGTVVTPGGIPPNFPIGITFENSWWPSDFSPAGFEYDVPDELDVEIELVDDWKKNWEGYAYRQCQKEHVGEAPWFFHNLEAGPDCIESGNPGVLCKPGAERHCVDQDRALASINAAISTHESFLRHAKRVSAKKRHTALLKKAKESKPNIEKIQKACAQEKQKLLDDCEAKGPCHFNTMWMPVLHSMLKLNMPYTQLLRNIKKLDVEGTRKKWSDEFFTTKRDGDDFLPDPNEGANELSYPAKTLYSADKTSKDFNMQGGKRGRPAYKEFLKFYSNLPRNGGSLTAQYFELLADGVFKLKLPRMSIYSIICAFANLGREQDINPGFDGNIDECKRYINDKFWGPADPYANPNLVLPGEEGRRGRREREYRDHVIDLHSLPLYHRAGSSNHSSRERRSADADKKDDCQKIGCTSNWEKDAEGKYKKTVCDECENYADCALVQPKEKTEAVPARCGLKNDGTANPENTGKCETYGAANKEGCRNDKHCKYYEIEDAKPKEEARCDLGFTTKRQAGLAFMFDLALTETQIVLPLEAFGTEDTSTKRGKNALKSNPGGSKIWNALRAAKFQTMVEITLNSNVLTGSQTNRGVEQVFLIPLSTSGNQRCKDPDEVFKLGEPSSAENLAREQCGRKGRARRSGGAKWEATLARHRARRADKLGMSIAFGLTNLQEQVEVCLCHWTCHRCPSVVLLRDGSASRADCS